MIKISGIKRSVPYTGFSTRQEANDNLAPACDWQSLRQQLLLQWSQLDKADLDRVGSDRHAIAVLVNRTYGISADLIENYLENLERTLPVEGGLYIH